MDRDLSMIRSLISVFIFSLMKHYVSSTIDINDGQLQMVADGLKMEECRKLSESLHENSFQLDHTLTGLEEPRDVSCLRLLQHWNEHEGREQTFHLLSVRLRELGHAALADRLARSVADEKTLDVHEAFLDDPFKPLPPPAVSAAATPPQPDPVTESSSSSAGWIVVFVALAVLFVWVASVLMLRCVRPDSYDRMRVSLYRSFLGKRPGKEDLFYIM